MASWLRDELKIVADRIAPASADASFRRYFRVWRGAETFVVMDAPPDKEDLKPYLAIVRMLNDVGVHVPRVLAEDHARGFLLLTDLGSRQYLEDLRAGVDVDPHYSDAIAALCRLQSRGAEHEKQLPPYDRESLLREMRLMPEWFCAKHLKIELTAGESAMLERTFDALCREALSQPQVFVHRDYHSRNLMVCPGDNPGILDFQDAVHGGITYDLVSLLKDCYIQWPRERVLAWVGQYREMAERVGLNAGQSSEQFVRWFDLMGAQRHIKVLGIFARLFHRDGKTGYLKDLPLTLHYVREICPQYPELKELGQFLTDRVVPILPARTAEALGQ